MQHGFFSAAMCGVPPLYVGLRPLCVDLTPHITKVSVPGKYLLFYRKISLPHFPIIIKQCIPLLNINIV
ncbi:hypothetical protein SB6095_01646 [Klebsiella quasivariicola]|uniref:Uncharacterized protein n=1 Tax=Klebsiella quasivariicola TaxID=2026240 RepID=A0ABY6XBK3_9ENTR|nr:Uncharacterised protein [Klebsiella quasivariicola]SLY35662.1 Uncharacterised protein [Klebsiella quasivariicola]SXD46288.1 Uncharacterised protein [Klebsiella quasivariicola]VAN53327.1 Uncharacterised protein [Klebsiella quasivariicola]VGP57282.1 hypothetical protein SB00033_05152 [Klebsiella quasivariicola]